MAALDRSLISQLPLFQGMTAEEQSEILRSARSSRYAKESTIFEQETEAHSFFVLISGHIRVVRTTPDGQQVIARYISEGEIFGVAAALGRTTYPASALAAVDCVVLKWPNALWAEMARRFPAFGATTYRTVGTRLQETQTRVVEMSTEQVEQRIAHALLRLANQTGRKTESGIEIDFPISRQDIAEMTGTTLHTVSRVLSRWEDIGIIASGRQKVTVKDAHRLVVLAENPGKH
ncbi:MULTISPECIES: Crp/Fnr family transcriptional regulator [unclassified Mesorhizobium]|uniref:Crp/Fnr family transcriptional regulator n=1 Tax=unclassified Mesorhizobium TaxID=325217 RepID=UPI000FDAF585|nr:MULTISPECIES: Crp/Fnr family transcriptional regulator [unclassified Mesorhizobium]TGR36849.1 Crp/Fnr family transcriptional regulator [bacterium M00.F.Ca.ET.199.01.1.1]TGU17725.1 Crp/Fnr family transcriptional regulator [bacterium M00.F.Ca.ET.156.01.1.1]TGV82023.1 Crp/Fnr family transcriptional regulator [Mesorhizobium sp. M00.F.Ca.ET.149.01.1.1]TGR16910.1 Crp/Fnr family transcriptional regulator [Mesorhizobium sp. M8A.F.Ca.ET.202.01.1.1]TGR18471.1 Crp/Fnr family transcriptional regulator 